MKYLFRFGFQSREQLARDLDDEDSQAMFILANTSAEALAWGIEVEEQYVNKNFGYSWKSHGFTHWIETDNFEIHKAEQLLTIPTITVGEYPPVWA